jgi:pyrroline-5-carboxylate reductase
MRIGIIGVGNMGATLAAQLHPDRASGRDRQLPWTPDAHQRRPDRIGVEASQALARALPGVVRRVRYGEPAPMYRDLA